MSTAVIRSRYFPGVEIARFGNEAYAMSPPRLFPRWDNGCIESARRPFNKSSFIGVSDFSAINDAYIHISSVPESPPNSEWRLNTTTTGMVIFLPAAIFDGIGVANLILMMGRDVGICLHSFKMVWYWWNMCDCSLLNRTLSWFCFVSSATWISEAHRKAHFYGSFLLIICRPCVAQVYKRLNRALWMMFTSLRLVIGKSST